MKGGPGAHAGYVSIGGDTEQEQVRWGPIIPSSWTLCTTSMYEEGGRHGRIFTGSGNNWLHGHHGGQTGASYYQGWKVNSWGNSNPGRYSWLVWCATNAKDDGVWGARADGTPVRAAGNVDTPTNELGTGWGTHGTEWSVYRIGTVMSWSRAFSTSEMKDMVGYMYDHLKGFA